MALQRALLPPGPPVLTAAQKQAGSADPAVSAPSKNLELFTRKQSRSVKAFILKASRPLLRNVTVQKQKSGSKSQQAGRGERTLRTPNEVNRSGLNEDANPDTDPLPLHALLELENVRMQANRKKSMPAAPRSNSMGPVDWVMAMTEEVAFLDWPALDWGETVLPAENGGGVAGSQPGASGVGSSTSSSPAAERNLVKTSGEDASSVTEDVGADALAEQEGTEKSRLALERMLSQPMHSAVVALQASLSKISDVAALPSSASVLADPVTVSTPMYPRCSWPREVHDGAVSSLAAAPMAPRCAWPRNGQALPVPEMDLSSAVAPIIDALPDSLPVELEVPGTSEESREALERTFAADPYIGAPHCAWPRRVGGTAGNAPFATSASPAPLMPAAKGAHCAWPRKNASPVPALSGLPLVAAHCAWPRKNASASVPMSASATRMDSAAVLMGPRCSWPKEAMPSTSVALPETVDSESPESMALQAPRCAWPRASTSGEKAR
eukprot:TRINITY_DN172_c0_g1_i1.p1 TRINITY_DN172_c0_g1~~TRINITY_DN172_c0_g1_i1.p1  ORF type:complete len:497 (-),score=62.90 TRINITY_DN172_c0_g1_i1:1109-2599(-)